MRITFGASDLVDSRASGNSLIDGNYEILIRAADTLAVQGGLPMQQDSVFGNEEVDQFFRFFGGSDGDRDVDLQDFGAFRSSFLTSELDTGFNAGFDFEGDGDIDGQEFGQMRRRLNSSLDF